MLDVDTLVEVDCEVLDVDVDLDVEVLEVDVERDVLEVLVLIELEVLEVEIDVDEEVLLVDVVVLATAPIEVMECAQALAVAPEIVHDIAVLPVTGP